ncbi:MAG: cell division protein ZapA [Proteobacteria bacterium]|nr:cell division protein ZapA [Pseudomonadota bacterium]
MAQVTITIDGKQFRMACEDGQEPHLGELAAHLDTRIQMMRQSFGEIGDLRLTVMAALMVCDELSEEKKKVTHAESAVEADRLARQQAASSENQKDTAIAGVIDSLSQRIERITRVLSGAATAE